MNSQKLMNVLQSIFGSALTILAIYTFLTIKIYIAFDVITQLYILWNLIALCLFVYGAIQLSHGLIAINQEEE